MGCRLLTMTSVYNIIIKSIRILLKIEWGIKVANDNKKFIEEITPMEKDFAQWYTDIVKKTDLVDYSSVKGCMILSPL